MYQVVLHTISRCIQEDNSALSWNLVINTPFIAFFSFSASILHYPVGVSRDESSKNKLLSNFDLRVCFWEIQPETLALLELLALKTMDEWTGGWMGGEMAGWTDDR